MNGALGEKKASNRLRIGHGINLAFFDRQTKLADPVYFPGNILARVNPVIAQYPAREDERWRSQARNANSFALQIRDRVNVRAIPGLHAETAAMNASSKLHIRSF